MGRGSVEDRYVNIVITLTMNMLNDVIKCEMYFCHFNIIKLKLTLYFTFCIIYYSTVHHSRLLIKSNNYIIRILST